MVTQFRWPRLSTPFYVFCHSGCLLSSTSGCPHLPTDQTLTVTHFFPHQIDDAPSRLISPIGQPVWSFVPDIWVYRFHLSLLARGNNGAEGELFSHQDRPWLCILVDTRTDGWETWPGKQTQRHQLSAWSHKWWFQGQFGWGVRGAAADSPYCSSTFDSTTFKSGPAEKFWEFMWMVCLSAPALCLSTVIFEYLSA